MAGFYEDAPGMRMAYDADGTVVVIIARDNQSPFFPLSAPVQQTGGGKVEANDEDNATALFDQGGARQWTVWIFPELREVDGFFASKAGVFGGIQFLELESSSDTTSGLDGAWTTAVGNLFEGESMYAQYRNEITSLALNGQRAIRQTVTHSGTGGTSAGYHIYGEISPGETPDRLIFIDELTGLEFELPKDFGDVPRGSAREFQWRLKNNSTVGGNNLTINTIQFTAESLYLSSGGWYTHSIAGDAFQSTKSIPSLAPEASSALITTRQIIPVNEVLGPHVARIRAAHTSLS